MDSNNMSQKQQGQEDKSVLSSPSELNIDDFMSENRSPEEIIKGSILSMTEVLGDLQSAAVNAETRMMTHEDSTQKITSILTSYGDELQKIKEFIGMSSSNGQEQQVQGQQQQAMGQVSPTQPMNSGGAAQQGQLSPEDARAMLANIAQASQQQQ